MAAQTMSAKEAALELGTDARTLRKFLREITPKDEQPGQGGRWSFTKGDVTKLKKKFSNWAEGAAKKSAAKDEAPATEAKGKKSKKAKIEEPEEIDLEDEDVDFEDLDDDAGDED